MAPRSFFLQFKPNLSVLIKFSFRSKRKRRPPSPTSTNLPDSSVQDVPRSSSEKEYSFVVGFDPDMWLEILSYCEVVDIVHVGMTCRSLASMTKDGWVWHSALLRISHNRRLPHLRLHIKSLSNTALRQKAILLARLDRLPLGLHRTPSHYTTTRLSLLISSVWCMSFLPGGEWLVVLCRKDDEDGVMLCRSNDLLAKSTTYASMPGDLTDMRIFSSENGDLLMVLRSEHPDGTRLGIYLIHLSEGYPPKLEMIWTVAVQQIENFSALGSYVVYGWIDRSQTEPRHLIKVLKFESCYRKLAEYSAMKVGWETGKHSHSYALRVTDSQITVVVSNTTLIAAYKAPPMVSASITCEPTAVEPFWRFPCGYMAPRAVHLLSSLPAVDTPSITIFYGDRCRFIVPSFDTDPPGIHPTYFSTYTYPRELKATMLLGPQRALWDLGHGRVGIGSLPTPLQPAFCERDSFDITGINVPEADFGDFVHPLVYAEDYNRRVASAAWDEESGKLALFPMIEYQRGEDTSIIIVDFMH